MRGNGKGRKRNDCSARPINARNKTKIRNCKTWRWHIYWWWDICDQINITGLYRSAHLLTPKTVSFWRSETVESVRQNRFMQKCLWVGNVVKQFYSSENVQQHLYESKLLWGWAEVGNLVIASLGSPSYHHVQEDKMSLVNENTLNSLMNPFAMTR